MCTTMETRTIHTCFTYSCSTCGTAYTCTHVVRTRVDSTSRTHLYIYIQGCSTHVYYIHECIMCTITRAERGEKHVCIRNTNLYFKSDYQLSGTGTCI